MENNPYKFTLVENVAILIPGLLMDRKQMIYLVTTYFIFKLLFLVEYKICSPIKP